MAAQMLLSPEAETAEETKRAYSKEPPIAEIRDKVVSWCGACRQAEWISLPLLDSVFLWERVKENLDM